MCPARNQISCRGPQQGKVFGAVAHNRRIRFCAVTHSGEKCSALWLTTGGSDCALWPTAGEKCSAVWLTIGGSYSAPRPTAGEKCSALWLPADQILRCDPQRWKVFGAVAHNRRIRFCAVTQRGMSPLKLSTPANNGNSYGVIIRWSGVLSW